MIDLEYLFNISPFTLDKKAKSDLYLEFMKDLSIYHYHHCKEYKKIIDTFNINLEKINDIRDIPYLPVRLFKEFELKNVKKENVFKTMTSSGTSGQAVSKIFLDKITASKQQKTLVKIVSDFT